MLNKLNTLKVKNGRYAQMRVVQVLADAVVYYAKFTHKDGYTEQRVCTVKNNSVVAWQS